MGTFLGHLVPGLAIASLGLWHTVNAIHVFFLNGSNNFILRFWYPFKTPLIKLQHLELILLLSFSTLAILLQILDFQPLRFSFELHRVEHATMFLQLLIFATFTLLAESRQLPGSISGILVASIFGQELFLLRYHSTDHVGLEGHYHWLMQLIVCVSFAASLCATASPASFPASLVLSMSVVFQGCWFINMGFVLWGGLVPRGCEMWAGNGAVKCGSEEADMRARALANLQFCWIFSCILVATVLVWMGVGRVYGKRRESVEYEQLSTPVAFKQIQL